MLRNQRLRLILPYTSILHGIKFLFIGFPTFCDFIEKSIAYSFN